ncbi:Nn.00g092120.m01.CDS01 [Neocucurbitaria sp. VM-36]
MRPVDEYAFPAISIHTAAPPQHQPADLAQGLYKLQLISEAKKACPDVVIVLGEDLTRFRNASKDLYAFLRSFSWNSRCERLGFDEVFMDVSDIIDFNIGLLNSNDLGNSFFCLSKNDPTVGFPFDATKVAGYTYPEAANKTPDISSPDPLHLRLLLGSHLVQHLRVKLELEKGYTATVGVSTNKLLAKLVGNPKPNGQTTLLPPYLCEGDNEGPDNVTSFMDGHEVGKLPGIGFKIAQKLRAHVLQRPADFGVGLVYGGTRENVRVGDARNSPGMNLELLERILGGPGTPHDIGIRVWGLLNGCDDTPVSQAREVPKQISIEDSYMRLDTLNEVTKELRRLATSLLKRMHVDLVEDEDEDGDEAETEESLDIAVDRSMVISKRWIAHPKTIRLSTRPRPPQNPDGSRNRTFARISKSAPMPTFVFSLKDTMDAIAEKLVIETLIPLFRRLHPEKNGWNLSLVNVAATNMINAASERGGVGRDISKMFKRQDYVLKQWRVEEDQEPDEVDDDTSTTDEQSRHTTMPKLPDRRVGSEDAPTSSQMDDHILVDRWESEDEVMADADAYRCNECGATMPSFAMGAHARWHLQK